MLRLYTNGCLDVHDRTESPNDLSVPIGTQVVLRQIQQAGQRGNAHPQGTVAEIVQTPHENQDGYMLRCADGTILNAPRAMFSLLKQVKRGPVGDSHEPSGRTDLHRFIVYRCVVGSQAYGLNRAGSDVDRRGVYVPPGELEWSLYGVPEQLENRETEECYWELKKFLSLALKANPNILECLFTPIVEECTEIGNVLRDKREIFLSKLVFQTYNGYVMSQFKKLEQDIRTRGEIGWKHAMHLIRLLLQGIETLSTGKVPVGIPQHREALLRIRDGQNSWAEINAWRLRLHRDFEEAYRTTKLPDAPDYEEANRLLIWARRRMAEVRLDS